MSPMASNTEKKLIAAASFHFISYVDNIIAPAKRKFYDLIVNK